MRVMSSLNFYNLLQTVLIAVNPQHTHTYTAASKSMLHKLVAQVAIVRLTVCVRIIYYALHVHISILG